MPAISYQLYSSRNWPIEETVAMLEDLGVEEVEGFGPLYDDPAATKALLDAHGLKMTTGHFALDLVEGDPERTLEIARILGVEAVIVPWIAPDLRPIDKAGWQALA